MKQLLKLTMGALAITAALAAAPASAQHADRSYFGGGAATFERVMREYGPQVSNEVKQVYSQIVSTVKSQATKAGAKALAKKLVKSAVTKNVVGIIVDLLWPTRLDPR